MSRDYYQSPGTRIHVHCNTCNADGVFVEGSVHEAAWVKEHQHEEGER